VMGASGASEDGAVARECAICVRGGAAPIRARRGVRARASREWSALPVQAAREG